MLLLAPDLGCVEKLCNTWEGEVPASRLVSDSVVHNLQVFRECLGQAAVSLRYKLFLAFGAGDQVDQVSRLTVNPAVYLHHLA